MNTWGPDGARAAVVLTFDNLGEAQDLEFGSWPQGQPLGRHPSVLIVLPRILAMLAELQLPASFFVESINVRYGGSTLELGSRRSSTPISRGPGSSVSQAASKRRHSKPFAQRRMQASGPWSQAGVPETFSPR
jgi:hypothetical protein